MHRQEVPVVRQPVPHALALIVAVDSIGFGLLVPVLPYLAEYFGARPALVTQLVASYGLAAVASGPILGSLGDRFGERRVLSLALGGLLLAYLGVLFARSIALVFAARILAGAMAGNEAIAQSIATKGSEPKDRMRSIATLGTFRALGTVAGPILASTLSLLSLGHAAYYQAVILLGSAFALLALLASFAIPSSSSPRTPPTVLTASQAPADQARGASADSLTLSQALLLTAGASFGFGIISSATALYVERAFSWHSREVGLVLGLCAAAVVLSRLLMRGPAASKIGTFVMVGYAYAAMFAAMLLVALNAPSALFVASYAVFCFAYGVLMVTTTTAIAIVSPITSRGRSLGFNQATLALSIVAAAIVSGPLLDLVALRAPYFAATAAIATVYALFLLKRHMTPLVFQEQ